jgi:hypothetical protein
MVTLQRRRMRFSQSRVNTQRRAATILLAPQTSTCLYSFRTVRIALWVTQARSFRGTVLYFASNQRIAISGSIRPTLRAGPEAASAAIATKNTPTKTSGLGPRCGIPYTTKFSERASAYAHSSYRYTH